MSVNWLFWGRLEMITGSRYKIASWEIANIFSVRVTLNSRDVFTENPLNYSLKSLHFSEYVCFNQSFYIQIQKDIIKSL